MYFQGNMTQGKLLEFLSDIGISISAGQLSNLLIQDHQAFHSEKQEVYQAGLASSPWHHLDQTSARVYRHQRISPQSVDRSPPYNGERNTLIADPPLSRTGVPQRDDWCSVARHGPSFRNQSCGIPPDLYSVSAACRNPDPVQQ